MPLRVKQQAFTDLGDGLILRCATPADTEALAEFNGRIFGGGGTDEWLLNQTRGLMSGQHPVCKPRDFTVVEDTRRGRIVASLCLISQRWSYGGVPFGVGRRESV